MSFNTFPRRGWKVTLGAALAVLSAATPFVWAGSVCLRGLPGAGSAVQGPDGGWGEVCAAVLPNPGALLAGALLLIPFGLSTLRLWRRA